MGYDQSDEPYDTHERDGGSDDHGGQDEHEQSRALHIHTQIHCVCIPDHHGVQRLRLCYQQKGAQGDDRCYEQYLVPVGIPEITHGPEDDPLQLVSRDEGQE